METEIPEEEVISPQLRKMIKMGKKILRSFGVEIAKNLNWFERWDEVYE